MIVTLCDAHMVPVEQKTEKCTWHMNLDQSANDFFCVGLEKEKGQERCNGRDRTKFHDLQSATFTIQQKIPVVFV